MVAQRVGAADRRTATEAVESSMAAYWLSLSDQGHGQRHDGPDLKWVYTGRPMLNRVVGARLEAADADARIAEVKARFGAWGASVTWLTGPSSRPADLRERLQEQGFSAQGDWIGMSLDLSGAPLATPDFRPGVPPVPSVPPMAPGLVIREVVDGATARSWLQTIGAGFRLPAAARETFRGLPTLSGPRGLWRRYVGFVAGRPVSTATLFTGGGIAGVYLVATVPEARGRGLGGALTRHALAVAQADGHELAVLQATPAGQDLYRKIGFRPCCTLGVYRWAPSAGRDVRHHLGGALKRLLRRAWKYAP